MTQGFPVVDELGQGSQVVPKSVRNVVAGASAHLVPSGGDDSAAMISALTSFVPFVSPFIVLGPGAFLWNASVPAIARNTPTRILGSGVGQTTIRLSASAPRAFDFGKVADYDLFDGIELSDFTVDCNNVGGQHHVVIGTYQAGAQMARISVNHFAARRIRTINVPGSSTGTTDHRLNLWIAPTVGVGDNLCTLFHHTYEDLDFMGGGHMGLVVAGVTAGGNCQFGWIKVDNVRHDTLIVNGSAFASSNVQIGSGALGVGPVWIDRIYGAHSADVGIEVDNCPDVTIGTATFLDNVNSGVFLANIGYTIGSAQLPSQVARVGKVTFNYQQTFTGVPVSYGGNPWGAVEVGSINLFVSSAATNFPFAIHLLGCTSYDIGEITYIALGTAGATNFNKGPINPIPVTGTNTRLHIGHYNEQISGAWPNATWQGSINAGETAGATTLDLQVDRVTINNTLSLLNYNGIYNDTARRTNFIITGAIRGVKVIGSPTVTNTPAALFFLSLGANPPSPLKVEGCDFSGFNTFTPTNIYSVNNTAGSFSGVISARFNTYPATKIPAPFNVTGLTTAVGAQHNRAWNHDYRFAAGTGAGITAIDYSTDGGANYTNVLTQAAGALPAGWSPVLADMSNQDLIKVTFTTTQPTVTAVPRLP